MDSVQRGQRLILRLVRRERGHQARALREGGCLSAFPGDRLPRRVALLHRNHLRWIHYIIAFQSFVGIFV